MELQLAEKNIDELVNHLQSKDGLQRERARKMLVRIGNPAVPALIELLSHAKYMVRWDACKTLAEISDPEAAAPLVLALDDERMEVRWVAAEALIALKKKGLYPLLRALTKHFDSIYLRESAHHILYTLEKEHLLNQETTEVLNALRFIGPRISVAIAAKKAMDSLHKEEYEYKR